MGPTDNRPLKPQRFPPVASGGRACIVALAATLLLWVLLTAAFASPARYVYEMCDSALGGGSTASSTALPRGLFSFETPAVSPAGR
jgi:hypothetical protein